MNVWKRHQAMCNLRFSTLILCKCTVNIAQFVDLLNTHFSFPKALVSHVISCHVKSRWCFLCTIVFPTAGDNCFIRDISGMLQLHLEDPGATVQSDASWLCMHDSFSPSWLCMHASVLHGCGTPSDFSPWVWSRARWPRLFELIEEIRVDQACNPIYRAVSCPDLLFSLLRIFPVTTVHEFTGWSPFLYQEDTLTRMPFLKYLRGFQCDDTNTLNIDPLSPTFSLGQHPQVRLIVRIAYAFPSCLADVWFRVRNW